MSDHERIWMYHEVEHLPLEERIPPMPCQGWGWREIPGPDTSAVVRRCSAAADPLRRGYPDCVQDRSGLDLSGIWRAAPADDDLRRDGIGMGFDDSGWEPVSVPGHWRSTPAFAESDGPLIYRTDFTLPPPTDRQRSWVTLDGVFYQGDVWLDGAYLGDPEGYFSPHTYEMTSLARLTAEHVLAVEVTCSRPGDLRAKRNITGIFQHGNVVDPAWNPGGLWRPVRIETTGPVRISTLRVLSRDVNESRANVILRANLDSDQARSVRIRTLVDGHVLATHERPLARRVNEVEWNIDIENPRIWWPWSLGDQPMVDIRVEIEVDHELSDSRDVRTGLREVALNDWVFAVNGERLFTKGVHLAPTRMALGEVTPDELHHDVELAKEAGLDLIRVHGHISRPELYDAADELGVLVWQDFPLQWGYARSVRHQAVTQAVAAVDMLGHHPSIAVWCGHNEPIRLEYAAAGDYDSTRLKVAYVAGQQLPTWNRSILDRWVKRAFEKADETRPAIAHSGVLPHLPQLDGTDSHLYFGWYHGDERDLAKLAASAPRLVRFVGEFGAEAVPESAEFMAPDRWPELDWETLGEHRQMQKTIFDERVPTARYASFDDWRAATQRYQADVIRHQIEALRRLKYRPTGGFCLFALADAYPAVSCSVLDHDRVPKAAYQAVVEACRPVIVVLERMPAFVAPGTSLALDVHVVNDLHVPVSDAVVTVRLAWTTGEHEWRFGGVVEADACGLVGTIQFVVPDIPGILGFDLTLDAPTVAATNRYETLVTRD